MVVGVRVGVWIEWNFPMQISLKFIARHDGTNHAILWFQKQDQSTPVICDSGRNSKHP